MKKQLRSTLILFSFLVASLLAVYAVQTHQRRGRAHTAAQKQLPVNHPRIVSLVPSVTETLFMLGLGDHVVARSSFCDFPEVVTNLPTVGSLGDVNIEAIARLKPDFVILSDAQAQSKIHAALAKLKISHIGVPANSLEDIYQSVWDLAQRFDACENATIWLGQINAITAKAKAAAPKKAPRILVCAGRDPASLDRLYISGRNNFYAGIMTIIGGTNAYTGPLPFPMVSLEGVIKMNPDIIVDIITGDHSDRAVFNALYKWGDLATVNAVKSSDVHILTEPWAVRPGPRIGLLINTMSDYVAEWDKKKHEN